VPVTKASPKQDSAGGQHIKKELPKLGSDFSGMQLRSPKQATCNQV